MPHRPILKAKRNRRPNRTADSKKRCRAGSEHDHRTHRNTSPPFLQLGGASHDGMTNMEFRRKVGYRPRSHRAPKRATSHSARRSHVAFLSLDEERRQTQARSHGRARPRQEHRGEADQVDKRDRLAARRGQPHARAGPDPGARAREPQAPDGGRRLKQAAPIYARKWGPWRTTRAATPYRRSAGSSASRGRRTATCARGPARRAGRAAAHVASKGR